MDNQHSFTEEYRQILSRCAQTNAIDQSASVAAQAALHFQLKPADVIGAHQQVLLELAASLLAQTLEAYSEARVKSARSDLHYKFLVDTMHGGIAILDADERFTYVNPWLCRRTGYSEAELLGASSFAYVDDASRATLLAEIEKRKTGVETSYDLIIRSKAGERIHLWITARPLYDDEGSFAGSFSVSSDITQLKRMEEELKRALEAEKEVSLMRSRFMSMASHEFRTPLSVIQSSADLLHNYFERMSAAQREQKFETILTQVRFMAAMLDDVLLIGRIESGRVDFDPQPVSLSEHVQQILDEFQTAQQTHRIHYKTPSTEVRVVVDKKLFRQIMFNLLSNAVKYSPADTNVDVSLEALDDRVILRITDYGIGIPEEEQSLLFGSFRRGSNVGAIQGTGLGLTIASRAVELHRGEISVQSQLGVETTFSVKLPLARL